MMNDPEMAGEAPTGRVLTCRADRASVFYEPRSRCLHPVDSPFARKAIRRERERQQYQPSPPRSPSCRMTF